MALAPGPRLQLAPFDRPRQRHRPVGPQPSYVEAVAHHGREGARSLWEAFREDIDDVSRLASELGRPSAVERVGGFVLARTRTEALDLAEGEDLLREDGFSGEFLDHFLLEARFDVRGVAAGYWAVDDLVVDEEALVEALRAEHGGVPLVEGRLRVVDAGPDVAVETAGAPVRAECLILAVADPRALPGLAPRQAVRDEPWISVEHPLPDAFVLPCPARSWDGRVSWQRKEGAVSVLAAPADVLPPLDWVAGDPSPAVHQQSGVAAVSCDGLPLIGAMTGAPVFLLHGGSGFGTPCAVAGARWVVAAALEGRDECPALLRAGRFG